MVKTNKSISIDKNIAEKAEEQARNERRSFSSLVEYLLDKYLTALKKPKRGGEN